METFFYALLNDKNICAGISSLNGEVTADNMIQIENYNSDIIGKKYNKQTKKFEEMEQEEVPSQEQKKEPTEQELIIMDAMAEQYEKQLQLEENQLLLMSAIENIKQN